MNGEVEAASCRFGIETTKSGGTPLLHEVGGMSDKVQIPATWAVAPLPTVASINPPKGKIQANASVMAHFVPMACVTEEFGGIDVSTTRPLNEVIKGYTAFVEGDVLFAKITPCMENGKIAVVPPLSFGLGFGSTEFHVLRATEAVLPKWIAHFLSQTTSRRNAQRSMTGSAGQLRVPALWLSEQLFPIPPLPEQNRIVAKIEELFSDLDAGVAALERAKANLKRYRAAVLKAAVEGKLTEEWRVEAASCRFSESQTNSETKRQDAASTYEPASKLLERILKERRQKWEAAQLAKFAKVEAASCRF
jgi:type I restriction enzyme S subunit